MAGLTVPNQVFTKADVYATGRLPKTRVREHTKGSHVEVADISTSKSSYIENITTYQAKEILQKHYAYQPPSSNSLFKIFVAPIDYFLWILTVPAFLLIVSISFLAISLHQVFQKEYWALPAPIFGTLMFTIMGVISWRFQRKVRELS